MEMNCPASDMIGLFHNGRMRMAEEIFDFDPAEMLDSDEAVEAYLDEVLKTGDTKFIASALGVVARAEGMTKISRGAGLRARSE
jgi:probable addiction module antidote protein